jgi:hypothetical protein
MCRVAHCSDTWSVNPNFRGPNLRRCEDTLEFYLASVLAIMATLQEFSRSNREVYFGQVVGSIRIAHTKLWLSFQCVSKISKRH